MKTFLFYVCCAGLGYLIGDSLGRMVAEEPLQSPEVITVYEERCFSEEAQYLEDMVSAHEHYTKMRAL